MQQRVAAGSFAFTALGAGVVACIIPWLLTGWHIRPARVLPYTGLLRVVGLVLLVAGTLAVVHAFARFVMNGRSNPAPPAPTERPVVTGLYRTVRNPLYLAVIATIVGQGLLLRQPVLLLYAGAVGAVMALFGRDRDVRR